MKKNAWWVIGLVAIAFSGTTVRADGGKAREVVAAAIDAMGGKHYLEVRNAHSFGRYFMFNREGRKGYTAYYDWTNFDPIKWRFQMGEGKRQTVEIYNLELGKGWSLEGKDTVSEAKSEDVERFRKAAYRDMDLLLRKRLDEEGMNLYYFSPDDVAGAGQYEAVEFLDSTNQSVIIFFDLKTHLPAKLETQMTDKMGIRHKEEVEYLNWHTIQNVHTPLRIDVAVDGKMAQQRFIEKLEYNLVLADDLFLEPKIEKKK
jgi:hypothetical protein